MRDGSHREVRRGASKCPSILTASLPSRKPSRQRKRRLLGCISIWLERKDVTLLEICRLPKADFAAVLPGGSCAYSYALICRQWRVDYGDGQGIR
jgi:hypothetical protein